MKTGKYIISDPCYIFSDENYRRLLEETDFFNDIDCIDSRTGLSFVVFSTKYGDGEYKDNKGRKYYVDAGCIGIYPIELCDKLDNLGDYYHEEEYFKEFECNEDNGILKFGNLRINTR